MNKLDATDVLAILIVVLLMAGMLVAGVAQKSELKRYEIAQKELLLKSYELETARTEAEAMLIYAKALEVSCSSELVNKWGEVYSR